MMIPCTYGGHHHRPCGMLVFQVVSSRRFSSPKAHMSIQMSVTSGIKSILQVVSSWMSFGWECEVVRMYGKASKQICGKLSAYVLQLLIFYCILCLFFIQLSSSPKSERL